jgi:cellulose synthase/poly-beta-1,6-N-acetylglucosamine synthase-like glycosyltransferase
MRDNKGLDAYDLGFQASAANGEVYLSIIMPTYNEGPTIRRAVRQVLSTSYPCRTELIVVDDGSSDEPLSNLTDSPVTGSKSVDTPGTWERALPS